jgi:hypothetical protein
MIQNRKLDTKFFVCTEIRKMLLEDPELNELVGNQIYPIVAPEGTKGDYIVYVRDQYSISRTKQGIYEQSCIVFISCVSESYDTSQKLASSVFNCLDGRHKITTENLVINSIEMLDSTEDYTGDVYIQTLEFSIK